VTSRGQSVTEFALVLPILLFVLLTVADFGRFFATGISIESSARTAAELAAGEYVAETAGGIDPKNYALIDSIAWRSVCNESVGLPNVTPPSGGSQCDHIPTMVCVHDTVDSLCGATYNSPGGIPPQCGTFQNPPDKTALDAQSKYLVEVRVCYRFSTILQVTIPFIGTALSPLSGDFYIERTRTFTVADY
jgi:hypothetical protein